MRAGARSGMLSVRVACPRGACQPDITLSALNVARARDAMRAAARRARHACARGGAGGTHRARVMAPWRWGACCVGRACARGRLLEGGGRANLTILPQNGSPKATGVHTELEHPFSLFFTGFRRHLIELVWAPAHSQGGAGACGARINLAPLSGSSQPTATKLNRQGI